MFVQHKSPAFMNTPVVLNSPTLRLGESGLTEPILREPEAVENLRRITPWGGIFGSNVFQLWLRYRRSIFNTVSFFGDARP